MTDNNLHAVPRTMADDKLIIGLEYEGDSLICPRGIHSRLHVRHANIVLLLALVLHIRAPFGLLAGHPTR